ncbi:uncharacterized mitochondrial protein AtMg00860-like [Spinacia oleracea]|uniref:Uncharacterized mitochondrial protein AtMg00860-like n=1 Tax=Spinacia oleracea TaxID=3562 RepID=A0ABM3R899_SPIOL|nr:uncharacterized mitochondrial protein AtMg00860-like [Spinacia oleracea]
MTALLISTVNVASFSSIKYISAVDAQCKEWGIDEGEHVGHLRSVLATLRENELNVKFSKCEFWLEKFSFLGHFVSKKGVEVDPSNNKGVSEWPTPKSGTDIRSVLCLAGYYRRFVNDFSRIAKPITSFMKKESKFIQSDKCEEAFQIQKTSLTSTPVLTLPDERDCYDVFSDASNDGFSCVLMQTGR